MLGQGVLVTAQYHIPKENESVQGFQSRICNPLFWIEHFWRLNIFNRILKS